MSKKLGTTQAYKDISGQKYGRLTAMYRSGTKRNDKGYSAGAIWHCLCDCGGECEAQIVSLTSGRKKSCGCLYIETRGSKKNLETLAKYRVPRNGPSAAVNRVIEGYKAAAKKRKIDFDLTEPEFKELIFQDCFYCGCSPQNIKKTKFETILWNGVDRMNPKEGYNISNCVAACSRCNSGKWTDSFDEFSAWVERVYLHYVSSSSYSKA